MADGHGRGGGRGGGEVGGGLFEGWVPRGHYGGGGGVEQKSSLYCIITKLLYAPFRSHIVLFRGPNSAK
jgi:hypothetical protein